MVVVQTDSTPSSNLKIVRVEETSMLNMELWKTESVSFLLWQELHILTSHWLMRRERMLLAQTTQ